MNNVLSSIDKKGMKSSEVFFLARSCFGGLQGVDGKIPPQSIRVNLLVLLI